VWAKSLRVALCWLSQPASFTRAAASAQAFRGRSAGPFPENHGVHDPGIFRPEVVNNFSDFGMANDLLLLMLVIEVCRQKTPWRIVLSGGREKQKNQTQGEHENSFRSSVVYVSVSIVAARPFSPQNPAHCRSFVFVLRSCRRQRVGANRFELRHGHLPAAVRHQLHVRERLHPAAISHHCFQPVPERAGAGEL
jgi:hypothetical protein